jgi:uncharacterized cupredoxin-like copper-binding protein
MSWKGTFVALMVISILLLVPVPSVDAKTLDVQLKDTLAFDPRQITAQPGEPLSLRLINDGVDAHTFTLFKARDPSVPLSDFAALLDYNATQEKIVDVYAGPGEVSWANFTAPSEPGNYVFVCMIPGHAAGGMHGVLTVGAPPAGGLPLVAVGLIVISVMVAATGLVIYILGRK